MTDDGPANHTWFPPTKSSWSLDVVTLLAVIGESSIAVHSQAITASALGTLPRILPAPQTFLKPSRPARMPETRACVTGVYSGMTLDSVGFFASIVTPFEGIAPYGFAVVNIKHAEMVIHKTPKLNMAWKHGWVALAKALFRMKENTDATKYGEKSWRDFGEKRDEEFGQNSQQDEPAFGQEFADHGPEYPSTNSQYRLRPVPRSATHKVSKDPLSSTIMVEEGSRPVVPIKRSSPMHVLSIFSCALSIAIIAAAAYWQDGMAILAVTLMSLASTVVGFASLWRPVLMKRTCTSNVPKGDVLIRTREGAIILVHCTEEVARELYSGTEECVYYVGGRAHRLLMVLGTLLLMVSVVLLGNCTWNSKIFIGVSYMVLNGLYWGLGMLPRSYFWDLSRYKCTDVTPSDARQADQTMMADDHSESHPSFTRTLWYAIRETCRVEWVDRSCAAPGTDQWKRWLREAEAAASRGERGWKAVQRMREIMSGKKLEGGMPDGRA